MWCRTVKALSRGGDPIEGALKGIWGKLHKIRYFRPDQGGANGAVWVQSHKDRAIERKLADVAWRHLVDFSRRWPVGLEIGDQNRVFRNGEAIDLAGHAFIRARDCELANDRNLGAAAGREQCGEVLTLDQKQHLPKQNLALVGR